MKKNLIIVLAALAAIALLGWFWLSPSDSDLIRTDTATIDRGDVVQIVSSVGSVRALNTVEVGSQLSGQIAELFADFNSQVEAGDLLARIDPQTFERRLQEAEANLAVSLANVRVQQASIQRAEAMLVNAQREYERQSELVGRGSVSAADLDASEANWRSAEADVAIARANLSNAEATVHQREAGRDSARIDLERTEIRSPINGVVIDRAVDEGQTVAASLSAPVLFIIAQDLAEIQIEASVDEADIGSVREGASAVFTVDAFLDRSFTGEVSQVRLAPWEEQNVVTYTVVIEASNPGRRLLPGMTASVDIETGRRENVLRVSNAAARFRPPPFATVHSASETRATAARSGPGGPIDQLTGQLSELGVASATIEQIQQELREEFAGFARTPGEEMDADQLALMRERMGRTSEEILARNLSPEQHEQLRLSRLERGETRSATLHFARPDGSLEARQVRLGLSDDLYTEIVAGPVAEGEQALTRVRQIESN